MTKSRKPIFVRKSVLMLFMLVLSMILMLPVTAKTASAATNGFYKKGTYTYYYVNGVKKTGYVKIGGYTYLFDSQGRMKTGWVTDSKGNKRYFYSNGKMAEGWVLNKTVNKKRYFYKGSGIMATGWVKNSAGEHRYFNTSNGYMYSGWATRASDGKKRYFNTSTGFMLKGFKKVGNYYYYFDTSNGLMAVNAFKKDGTKTYYLQSNGTAKKGWLTKSNKKYYFGTDYVMYVSKTATIDNKNYVFNASGVASEAPYTVVGNYVYVYENGRKYALEKEFLTHPGVADGSISDDELLAALCECEAGNQGLIGMEAVALCLLNRSIYPTKEWPSSIRYVIYQGKPLQYSPVRYGSLIKRLNGKWDDKATAMEAVRRAKKLIYDYQTTGKKRKLEGFPTADFNYLYFMADYAYYSMPLDFARVENYLYVAPNGSSHMFFVNWISPK
ncbi:MAG: cell wall hydrolase [Clostridiales bacterium]|nr:cell wall hydrolase [Candidatus Blautia equi]